MLCELLSLAVEAEVAPTSPGQVLWSARAVLSERLKHIRCRGTLLLLKAKQQQLQQQFLQQYGSLSAIALHWVSKTGDDDREKEKRLGPL